MWKISLLFAQIENFVTDQKFDFSEKFFDSL